MIDADIYVTGTNDLHSRNVSIIFVRKRSPMEERNDIVIYKSEDGLVKMEAMVDPAGETIWATQKAIAALFGVTVPDISYKKARYY